MNIETSNLLGGLIVGAALGAAGAVAAIWLLAGRISPQVSVRLARLFLADLRGTDSQEIFQLFRARAALHELGKLDAEARKNRGRTSDVGCPISVPQGGAQ